MGAVLDAAINLNDSRYIKHGLSPNINKPHEEIESFQVKYDSILQ